MWVNRGHGSIKGIQDTGKIWNKWNNADLQTFVLKSQQAMIKSQEHPSIPTMRPKTLTHLFNIQVTQSKKRNQPIHAGNQFPTQHPKFQVTARTSTFPGVIRDKFKGLNTVSEAIWTPGKNGTLYVTNHRLVVCVKSIHFFTVKTLSKYLSCLNHLCIDILYVHL